MGKIKNFGRQRRHGLIFELTARVALLSFLTGTVPMFPTAVEADTATGINTVSPGFDPTMPPQFNLASVAGQGAAFQSCNGQLQQSVQNAMQSIGGLAQSLTSNNSAISGAAGMGANASMGFGINAVCSGTDVGPTADSLRCDEFKLADGRVDMSAMQSKAVAIQMALGNVQCKKNKFQAIQNQLSCLSAQADTLSQQLTAIQGAYQTNIQRMQQDVQKINTVVSDRQSEDQDVLTRLNGSGGSTDANGNSIPGNGSKGLLGVRDGLCQALTGAACGSTGGGASSSSSSSNSGGVLSGSPDQNSIPGQIQTLKDQMTDAQNKQQQLTEAINERQMGLAGDCFNNRKEPQFQCVVNGPPVSAHDYVLCMYQQKLGINKNGQVDNSALMSGGIAANQNAAKEQGLSALLDQIMGDVPQKSAAPSANGQAPDPNQVEAATILTAADVQTQYGSQLAGFDTGNTPVSDFVMKNIAACFTRAQNVVTQEKNMASSPIGQQQAALTKAQGDLQANANQMLSGNVAKYEEAMTALTGMNMPLDTSKCNNATPAVQVSCLQDLQSNMESLLHGSAKQSTVTMNLSGTDPNTNISFTCQGLDGCITALQNVDRNLKSEVKRVQSFKQQYVTAAKQSVDNFTKQMAAMMSAQSSALNNQLKQMNTALASLGMGGITIPKVDCEQPDVDADGLPKVPTSSLKLIGCQMNPPMLDVSGSDFSSSLSSIGTGEKDLEGKLGPLNEAMNKLATLKTQCTNEAVGTKLTQTQKDADTLASGNCQYLENFCSSSNKSAAANLSSDMGDISGGGISADAISNIQASIDSGMSGCGNSNTAKIVWANNNCVGTPPPGVAALKGDSSDPGYVSACAAMKTGTGQAAAGCSGIVTRLQRDIVNAKVVSGGGDSNSGGAR